MYYSPIVIVYVVFPGLDFCHDSTWIVHSCVTLEGITRLMDKVCRNELAVYHGNELLDRSAIV